MAKKNTDFKVVMNVSDKEKKVKHAKHMQEKRKGWSEEEKKKNAEQSRERMKVSREEKTCKGEICRTKHWQKMTRLEERREEECKTLHREYKKKYRSNLSAQKKRRIREKDAAQKRAKRDTMKCMKTNQRTNVNDVTSPYTPSTFVSFPGFRKVVYRARKKLPKTPERYAAIVKALVCHTSPRTRTALKSQQLYGSPRAKKNLSTVLTAIKEVSDTFKGRTSTQRQRRRAFLSNFAKKCDEKFNLRGLICAATGIKKKYFFDCAKSETQKTRKDALQEETVEAVSEFYREIATHIPDKKAAKKDQEPKQVLQISTEHAWEQYCSKNGENKVSYDKFCKLRPKSVKTQKYRKLYQCLCEYCENVKLKIQAVNKLCEKEKKEQLKIKDEYHCVSETLCVKNEGHSFHRLECIDRKCPQCGVIRLEEKLEPLRQLDIEAKWTKWDIVKTMNTKTGKEVSKRQEVSKCGSPEDLIQELMEETKFLAVHLFQANWQQNQFLNLKQNLPMESVVITIDFAENFQCFAQNEVQGAHGAKDSVTVHPCVAWYKCPKDKETVEECIDVISNDLLHDSHAVHNQSFKSS